MRLMHTSLPEFKLKLQQAVVKESSNKEVSIRGLENLCSAKMQSLRTARIEEAVNTIAADKATSKVEIVVLPRVPETMHTVVVKGYDAEGMPTKGILEVINIIHPTEDVELEGFVTIEDRRPTIGKH